MDDETLAPRKIARIIGTMLLFGAVFLISLWAGRWLGSETRQVVLAGRTAALGRIAQAKGELKSVAHGDYQPKNIPPAAASNNSTIEPAPNRQRNILLIGIDSFQADEPRLEGVWMILYLQDLPHFMLMPIYPNRAPGDQNAPLLDQNLASLFHLEAGKKPNHSFIQALRDKELWWNGYLILDEAALDEIIRYASGDNKAAANELSISVSSIPDIQQDPLRALLGQARLAQELCRDPGMLLTSGGSQFPSLIARISAHMDTDLDLGEMAGEIQSALRYGGGISCEFPSLDAPPEQP